LGISSRIAPPYVGERAGEIAPCCNVNAAVIEGRRHTGGRGGPPFVVSPRARVRYHPWRERTWPAVVVRPTARFCAQRYGQLPGDTLCPHVLFILLFTAVDPRVVRVDRTCPRLLLHISPSIPTGSCAGPAGSDTAKPGHTPPSARKAGGPPWLAPATRPDRIPPMNHSSTYPNRKRPAFNGVMLSGKTPTEIPPGESPQGWPPNPCGLRPNL